MHPDLFDFVTSILLAYFSGANVQSLIRPYSVPYHAVVHFCMMQFKALHQLGANINMTRLRELFPDCPLQEIEIFPAVIGYVDDKVRIYLDSQGSVEKPQEVVLLVARGATILHIEHMMGTNRNPNYHERQLVKNVHGLPKYSKHSFSRKQMIPKIREIILQYDPTEIVIAKKECAKLLAGYRHRTRTIKLRKWKHRAAHYSYHAAYLASQQKIGPELLASQADHKHIHYVPRDYDPSMSVGELVKAAHGAQCSLYNAYEIFLFYTSLPCTVVPMTSMPVYPPVTAEVLPESVTTITSVVNLDEA